MTWAAFRNSPFAHPTLRETGWEWDRGQEQEWGRSQSDNCSALSGGAAGRGGRRLVLGGSPQFGMSQGQHTSRSGELVPVWDVCGHSCVSFWVASSSLGRPGAGARLVLGGAPQFGTSTMVILCQNRNQILKFRF